jgi:hypothetical protein
MSGGRTEAGRVILNVGGHRFETCSTTLISYPDTLLGAMFAKRNEVYACALLLLLAVPLAQLPQLLL